MKTYTRKRQEHQEIEGVEELCRLCLDKVEEGVPIFNGGKDVCAAVAMRIMICVGLEMKFEHSLPNMICSQCHEVLEKYYKFRKKCEVSYQKLKSHMLALQQKDVKELIKPEETFNPFEYNKLIDENSEEKQLVIEDTELPAELKTEHSPDVNEKIETEELQIPIQTEVNPDIGTFLTTVLTELGILATAGSALMLREEGITSFELEMGDDEQLMLELVEEDDVPNQAKIDVKQSSQEIVDLKEEPAVVVEGKPKQKNRKGGSKLAGPWCPVCGRVFSSASAAARHAAVHGGARPHACPTCRRTFTQKAVLERHMLVHQEVRPFACARCPKSFTQRGALAAHARAHAARAAPARALRLHRCAACDKVFLYASGLSRHMASHSGRVFPCGACDRSFTDRSSLRRHRNSFKHRPAADAAAAAAAAAR